MANYFWAKVTIVILVFIIVFEIVNFFGWRETLSWLSPARWIKPQQNMAAAIELEYFPPPTTFKLTAVGDLMLDRGVRRIVENYGNNDYNYVFSHLSSFASGSDAVLGNLEGPVATGGADAGNLYSFRMSPEVLAALKRVGFNLVSVSNNHAGDWGREAFYETLENLRLAGIKYVGGGFELAEATKPIVFQKENLKVGFLGFSDVGPGHLKVGTSTPGILLIQESTFSDIIAQASREVNVLVVTIHWGDEYMPQHNNRQELLAQKALKAGAKIVLGHHPHVIQDETRVGSQYIAYSLGNFVFDQNFSIETMTGLVLDLEIDKNGVKQINKRIVNLNEAFQPIISDDDLE